MNDRIRVMRVIARMNVGGPARQVVGLMEELDPGRFEQQLFVGRVDPDEVDHLEIHAPDLAVRRVEGLGRAPRAYDDARAFATLVKEVRRFKPHIVHTHTAKAGALGRPAARLGGTRALVHTFHGHLLSGYFSPTVTKGVIATERALAVMTSTLVAVGEQVRDDLLAAGIGAPGKFRVVPPGIADLPTVSRDDARRLLSLDPAVPVVVFVARLTSVKRPDRFLDVARAVVGQRPDAVFVVVGEGDLFEEMRANGADLGSNLRMLGWRADVETVYAASDIVLLTSDNEGMPVSLIEAAIAGRPAVTTRVGSAGEVVIDGETGFVVDRDVGELAAAVMRLVEDELLRSRLGAAATESATRRFSRGRLVADTARIYDELAERFGFG